GDLAARIATDEDPRELVEARQHAKSLATETERLGQELVRGPKERETATQELEKARIANQELAITIDDARRGQVDLRRPFDERKALQRKLEDAISREGKLAQELADARREREPSSRDADTALIARARAAE